MANHVALHVAHSVPSMAIDACVRMVDAASKPCAGPALPPVPTGVSTGDGLAALSTAFVYGSILLAILVVLAGFAWAKFVAQEAKEMAKTDAQAYISNWMAQKAPGIIQSHVELLNDATIGEGDEAVAADELGKEAG